MITCAIKHVHLGVYTILVFDDITYILPLQLNIVLIAMRDLPKHSAPNSPSAALHSGNDALQPLSVPSELVFLQAKTNHWVINEGRKAMCFLFYFYLFCFVCCFDPIIGDDVAKL